MSKKHKKHAKTGNELATAPESAKAQGKAHEKAHEKESAKAAAKTAAKTAAKEAKIAAKSAKSAAESAKAAKPAAANSDPENCAMPVFKHVRKKKLSSGKGPSPKEVGQSLVSLFNAGKSEEAESTWYHRKIESIEGDGTVYLGWKGVQEKGKWWKENFTVLSMRAEGPFVCATGFTVIYSGRVRMPDGSEVNSHEVGVYTVEKGRIVREQFMDRVREGA